MVKKIYDAIKQHAEPFRGNEDLDSIIDRVGDAEFVLLGEASHGTSEFYSIRAELSKRLIEEKGFSVITVEGDWPACQQVNQYIKGNSEKQSAYDVLQAFKRWPSWMWANEEIADFVNWLKGYNQQSKSTNVGFYGIDIYSLWESMDEIMKYLKKTEPRGSDMELAKKAFACFEPFNRKEDRYAISASFFSDDCVEEVTKLLASIRSNEDNYHDAFESDLNLKINALVAKNAEEYYRTMVQDDAGSWNIRDLHMVEALNEIRDYYGKGTKVIVWEHNTHVGDASATDMNKEGMINVGQIVREQQKKENVCIIGFGTHQGTVVAAEEWGVNLEKMVVPPAKNGSWEDLMHKVAPENKLLVFNDDNRSLFEEPVGHRAIGVVYNPAYESYGNYVPSVMSHRYDAFIYVDKTKALQPLELKSLHV